jgi:acyl-CoA dehydrogenase
MQTTQQASFQDIQEAVRDLCEQFSGEYFRKIDEARGYAEAFVDALTKAGWLDCGNRAAAMYAYPTS